MTRTSDTYGVIIVTAGKGRDDEIFPVNTLREIERAERALWNQGIEQAKVWVFPSEEDCELGRDGVETNKVIFGIPERLDLSNGDPDKTYWWVDPEGDVIGPSGSAPVGYRVIDVLTGGFFVGSVEDWRKWVKSELIDRGILTPGGTIA